MKRQEWKFSYSAGRLRDAAMDKVKFHKGRLEWWSGKQAEIKKSIETEGISIDESVAVGNLQPSYSNSAYRGPIATIREDLLRDLNETTAKVMEHRNKVRDYESWLQVMESQGNNVFDLHQDDWMFFFGK
jgi:hypothetical protein